MAYIMEGECLMSEFQVYKDLAERTGGEFYLGICGPVRTGKSTFIKRFMELLVLPEMEQEHERQRAPPCALSYFPYHVHSHLAMRAG